MQGSRILIVDDAFSMRHLIKEALLEEGFIVVGEAKNGIEAIAVYQEHMPDIVIMDIGMPEMDGIEATKRIIKLDKNARILILTEEISRETEALTAGALGFLTKPFQPAYLWRKIDKILEDEDSIREARREKLIMEKQKIAGTKEESFVFDEESAVDMETVEDDEFEFTIDEAGEATNLKYENEEMEEIKKSIPDLLSITDENEDDFEFESDADTESLDEEYESDNAISENDFEDEFTDALAKHKSTIRKNIHEEDDKGIDDLAFEDDIEAVDDFEFEDESADTPSIHPAKDNDNEEADEEFVFEDDESGETEEDFVFEDENAVSKEEDDEEFIFEDDLGATEESYDDLRDKYLVDEDDDDDDEYVVTPPGGVQKPSSMDPFVDDEELDEWYENFMKEKEQEVEETKATLERTKESPLFQYYEEPEEDEVEDAEDVFMVSIKPPRDYDVGSKKKPQYKKDEYYEDDDDSEEDFMYSKPGNDRKLEVGSMGKKKSSKKKVKKESNKESILDKILKLFKRG